MKCWRCSALAVRQCTPSTRRAEASVSKCGSRYLSTSCPTFAGSRRYASRSLSRSPSMPWAAFCTTSVGPSPAGAIGAGCGCAFANPVGRHAIEVAVESSGADADVLAAEQPLGLDAGVAVLGDVVVLRVDAQAGYGLVVLGIEADALHLAHVHPRHGHRGAHLEVTDVVELGAHV